MSKHVVIMGAGPGGVEAARTVASLGGRATLISDGSIGGRANWQTLLPSKAWIDAADKASIRTANVGVDATSIGEKFQAVAQAWQSQIGDELTALEVSLVPGRASFQSAAQIIVKCDEEDVGSLIEADAVIIATGARPFFPPGFEPDGERIFAPHLMTQLGSIPSSMVVIGDGLPATEYVDVFNRLGIEITWMVSPAFPAFHTDSLVEILIRRGVKVWQQSFTKQIEQTQNGVAIITTDDVRYEADVAFVAIGYQPDLSDLNVEAAGMQIGERGTISIDEFQQTDVANVYIVGDANGVGSSSITAAQARVAARHAMGVDVAPFRPECVVSGIYTDPQWAIVGSYASPERPSRSVRVPCAEVLAGHLATSAEGFLELAYDEARIITGGLAIGPNACEILATVALAIQMNATLEDLASIYAARPTFSELVFEAARCVGEETE
ncbi:MAG: NAD(P)/FAD-dependent oxidoreductase [Chloroflexota bacterium]